jgi:hypothetical protein
VRDEAAPARIALRCLAEGVSISPWASSLDPDRWDFVFLWRLNLSEICFSQCVFFLLVVFVTDALHSGDNVANTLLGVVAYSDSDAGTKLALMVSTP